MNDSVAPSAEMQHPAGSAHGGMPDDARTLMEVLESRAAHQSGRLHALLLDERHDAHPISYRELLDAARDIACGLRAMRLRPRRTVALMLPAGRDYLACFLGVMMAGGIPVPIFPPAGAFSIEEHLQRHARILSNAQAVLLITQGPATPAAIMLQAAVPSLAAVATPADLAARPAPDRKATPSACPAQAGDIAFLQYTSGSTGHPKGVVLTHANLLANLRALGRALRIQPDDVFVSWLPPYQDMGGIGAWLFCLYHGIPLVLLPASAFAADPVSWLRTISRHRGTISAAPDSAYASCARHAADAALSGLDLSCWRLALIGAEPVSAATLDAFASRLACCGFRREAMTPIYGLAESTFALALPPVGRAPRIDRIRRDAFGDEGEALPAASDADALPIPSCGHPLADHEIRIVDEAGHELPDRRIGRLQFRGPSATRGYYRNPEATAELFHDGWLDSGDLAYMAEGEVFPAGRVKDLIKCAGRNLYPYDVEEAVGRLAGIRAGSVVAFAARDPADGAQRIVVMAETEEHDEAARAQLRRHIVQIVADIAGTIPDALSCHVVFVAPHALRRTASGKIRRIASREAYEAGSVESYLAAPARHHARIIARMLLSHAIVRARQLRAWAYGAYIWSIFSLIVLAYGGLAILLHRPSLGRRIVHAGARLLFRLAGVPLSASGLDRLPKEPHVLVVNHTSFLDAIVLTALLPPAPGYAFIARQEFAIQRLLCPLLRSVGVLALRRAGAGSGRANVEWMTAALRRGQNLVIFPEGGFSRGPGLKPFHSGAFVVAANAGAPIVVAGLRGARGALRPRTWLPQRVGIALEIGPALQPHGSDRASIEQLRAAARRAMVPLSGEFDLTA